MEKILEIKKLLAIPKDVVITTHRNPDGDAIGSSLGLYHFLRANGHSVHIVSPSEYPDILAWMPGADDIVIYDIDPEHSEKLIKKADLIFCLDFNSVDRIDKVGKLVQWGNRNKRIFMIDHHLYPNLEVDYMLSDTSASSTCELVFDFIRFLEKGAPEIRLITNIDATIGECLFTGILTDTGSFKYSTSAKLFRIVSELLEAGVNDYKIHDKIFNSLKEQHLRLLGHCLFEANYPFQPDSGDGLFDPNGHFRMELLPEYRTGIIWLTKDDYARLNIKRGDTEGIVNYLLRLKNVTMAAFITEQPTIVKISLRSKGNFSVQEIAKKHFDGGGHKNAAGGAFKGSLHGALRKFKALLPEYKELLSNADETTYFVN